MDEANALILFPSKQPLALPTLAADLLLDPRRD